MTDAARVDQPCRLVSLATPDGRRLQGALYEPAGPVPAVASVLYIHGKGGNFYSGPGRFVPRLLHGEPIRHLSMNLRSHDLAYTRDDAPYQDFENGSTPADGGYWENLEDGNADIGAAVGFLRDTADVPVFVLGHSSGGYYSAMYCAGDERIAGQMLFSSVLDNKRALPFWFPGDGELDEACAHARTLVDRGEGRTLMPLRRWYYAISAQTLLQRAAQPDGAWIDAVHAARAALLLGWGGAETRTDEWQRVFEDVPYDDKRRLLVPDADHHFTGHEDEVAAGVLSFLAEFSGAASLGTSAGP